MAQKNNHYQPYDLPEADRHKNSQILAAQTIDSLDRLPLEEKKAAIRQILIGIGIDVAQNDGDPTGDGDQRTMASVEDRDIARHLFSTGGDIHDHFAAAERTMSKFGLACATGDARAVSEMIKRVARAESQPYSRSAAVLALLETRETSMRLSPLLLVVSVGKNIRYDSNHVSPNFQKLAKLLLEYGASPCAKDVMGKTVCHYGAGVMATNMTLEVVDMCIRAAKNHHMYGKEVQLHGLNTQEMNGKVGVAGGFNSDSGRRSVYLQGDGREVWIKPENMKLVEPSALQRYPPLTDIRDRLGGVSLHDLCMPQFLSGIGMPQQVDAAAFLLQKHDASIHTKDMDGISPFQMVSGMGQMAVSDIAQVVMGAAHNEAKRATKAKKQSKLCCAKCKVSLTKSDAFGCSRCKVTHYCGRECQVAHWKEHKKECKDLIALASGVRLNPPDEMKPPDGYASVSANFKTGNTFSEGKYKKPGNIVHDKKFVVKLQGIGDRDPIFVYDKTRMCQFHIQHGQPGFQQLLVEIRNEPAWQGRKTFMKASFDRSGTCTMYPDKTGVKAHYTW